MSLSRSLLAVFMIAGSTLCAGQPALAKRAKPQPCAAGRFLVAPTAEPLLTGVSPTIDAIGIDAAGHVSLDGCGAATKGKVKATRKATIVQAKWTRCGAFSNVVLAAKIAAPACDVMSGKLQAKMLKTKKFPAMRSTCGDQRVDTGGDETCDASAPNGDATCPGLCGAAGTPTACQCASTTTTTLPHLGEPIIAPADEWTWVDFPDSRCGNGTPTGIGVNPSTASSRVLIYLVGGGACWDELTCYSEMSAAYFTTGFGASDFTSSIPSLDTAGSFFDRTAAGNPFKDYSYVVVPYCTGDIHAGNNVATYGTHTATHVGFANMTAYLKRIVPTFPTADRVFLAGSSAGGFGALINWWQTQQLFGSVRVDLIDDSGTFMPADHLSATGMGYEQMQRTNWNLAATLPPGCAGCSTTLTALYGFYAGAFPNHRGTLLSYTMDSTLPNFFGITTSDFTMGLEEDVATYFDPSANLKVFLDSNSGHVLFFDPSLTSQTVTLEEFLTKMVTDDASWASVE